jgi:hypothetical protein
VSTKELYIFKIIQETNGVYLEIHTHLCLQKNLKDLFQITRVIFMNKCAPPLDVTSFENGYPQ